MLDLSYYNLHDHPDITALEWNSEEEWHELRSQGIGGSDTGAIMGISKYKTPLKVYKVKKGIVTEDVSNVVAVKKGKDLEALIRDLYVVPHFREMGYHVVHPECMFVNKTCPWLRANLDGIAVPLVQPTSYHSNLVIEIKWVSEHGEVNWDGDEYFGVPADYYAQVQHYMTVTGATNAYVCALFDRDWSMHYYRIPYDITFATRLLSDTEKFYRINLLQGIPPMLNPALDKEDAVKALDNMPKTFSYSDELSGKCEHYLYLKSNIKELSAEADALQQEILQGYYSGVLPTGAYSVSISKATRSGIDTAKLKEEYPDVYEACVTTSEFTRNTIKTKRTR